MIHFRMALGLLVTLVALAGCDWMKVSERPTRSLRLADFASPTTRPATRNLVAAEPLAIAASRPVATPSDTRPRFETLLPVRPTTQADTDDRAAVEALEAMSRPVVVASPASRPGRDVLVVDAMVGQVNGRPIYANAVFEPITQELSRLGAGVPRNVFQMRAREIIQGRVKQMVTDSLILGEAERDLSAREQMGLQELLKQRRQELLRQYGTGSPALADARSLEATGKTIDQTVNEVRQKLLVQRYLQEKLVNRINITRKDIERYYHEHESLFNTPKARTLRVIRVDGDTPAAADRIEALLEQGQPFEEAARTEGNRYRRDQGGLMPDKALSDEIFSLRPLNEALLQLKAGQHSPRLTLEGNDWWIYVQSIEPARHQPLTDVQLEIHRILWDQRFKLMSYRYVDRLFQEGSYNPVEQMTDALLAVAMSRYGLRE